MCYCILLGCFQHEERRRRNLKRAATHDDGVSAIDEEELTCERQCEEETWSAREENEYICYGKSREREGEGEKEGIRE